MRMRGENGYSIRQILNITESIKVPPWADYVDVVNDGGSAIELHVGEAMPVVAETGARVPLFAGELRVTVNALLRAPVIGTAPLIVAFLSQRVADVVPPPSKEPTNRATVAENVVQGAATRLVTWRAGFLYADIKFPMYTAAGAAQTDRLFIAHEAAACTVALGYPLDPGEGWEKWKGPLWVLREGGFANAKLDVIQAIKTPGTVTP